MKIFLILVFVSSIQLLNATIYLNKENLTERNENQTLLQGLLLMRQNSSIIKSIDNYFTNENHNRSRRYVTNKFLSNENIISELTTILQEGFKKCGLDKVSDMIFLVQEEQQLMRECVNNNTHHKVNALEDYLYTAYDIFKKQVMDGINDKLNLYQNNITKFLKMKHDNKSIEDIDQSNRTLEAPSSENSAINSSSSEITNNSLTDQGDQISSKRSNKENKGILIYMNFTTKNDDKYSNGESSQPFEQFLKTIPDTFKLIGNQLYQNKYKEKMYVK